MEHTANQAAIRGSLLELPQFSHENHGNRFYRFVLEVPGSPEPWIICRSLPGKRS